MGPMFDTQGFGGGVFNVEFFEAVIFVLDMVADFKGDFGSSPHEESEDFEASDLSVHSQSTIGVLSESF